MDWSNVGDGPAGMIADLLLANDVADYVCFRAVCRPWRLCTADPRAHGILDRRFHPRRWIMLREEVADPDRRRLLNISTGQCVRAHLPELRDHDVCAPTVEGLLLLFNRSTYAIRLLNPLTRQVSDLPPATTLYRGAGMHDAYPRQDFNVSYAGIADDATIAIVVVFNRIQVLAVAKLGDEQWTLVEQGTLISSAISFAGRFYCITGLDIKMLDTTDNQPPRLVVAAKNNHRFRLGNVYLLDNGGELMLLSRTYEAAHSTDETMYFVEYKVSRVDLNARKTQPIRDLGGRALFIGSSRAISLSPLAFPAIQKNSFYLGNVVGSSPERIGRYKIVDGTTMSFHEGSGVTEACGFDNIIPRYGPHCIVYYLSQYVEDTSYSFAEEDTSSSSAEEDTSDSS
jgi:hypothetical protein